MPMAVNLSRAGCAGKVHYRTRALAKNAAKAILQRRKDKLFPYFCEVCDGWHLGHRKDNDGD